MIDYVYEVRGTDDPIEGDKVRFKTKDEAMAYYEESKANHPNAAVYIVEYEFDDFEGADNMTSIPEQKTVVQIAGPDVETIDTPDGFPDSCAGDNCDNYDDNGMFRLPKYADDLDDMDENLVEAAADEEDDIPDDFDGIMDYLQADEDEAISGYEKAMDKVEDEFVKDQLNKIATEEEAHKDYLAKVVDDHTIEYTEPLEPEDDMTDEELGEALFSALSQKDLDEDAAGTIDDPVEGEKLCAWCGEAIPVDSLKFVDGVGLICARCQAALKAHAEDDSLKL